MNEHDLAEARSLAYHRVVAERIREDRSVLERARARVAGWSRDGRDSVHPDYARAWRLALDGPEEALFALLVDPGERARALRQVSPFAGVLSPRERWQLWRDAGARWREAS